MKTHTITVKFKVSLKRKRELLAAAKSFGCRTIAQHLKGILQSHTGKV